MPSIQQFARESEDTVLTIRDIDIAVTFNPDRVTVGAMKSVAQLERTYDFGAVAGLLDNLVEAWDVTGPLYGEDEDGEPVELVADGESIPFTEECLEALGMNFVMEFMNELLSKATEGPNPTRETRRSRKR